MSVPLAQPEFAPTVRTVAFLQLKPGSSPLCFSIEDLLSLSLLSERDSHLENCSVCSSLLKAITSPDDLDIIVR